MLVPIYYPTHRNALRHRSLQPEGSLTDLPLTRAIRCSHGRYSVFRRELTAPIVIERPALTCTLLHGMALTPFIRCWALSATMLLHQIFVFTQPDYRSGTWLQSPDLHFYSGPLRLVYRHTAPFRAAQGTILAFFRYPLLN